MQWSKKLELLQDTMAKELKTFLAPRMRDVKAPDVAADIIKQCIKIDMNRSAARLRRYLYAQWGRLDMVAGEWFKLGENGLEEREFAPAMRDLGDLHVDPFRVFSITKMLGYAKGARLSNEDRVKANHLVLRVVHSHSISPHPVLTHRQVAVLMVTHAVEASREVERSVVLPQVGRHFPQWNITVPADAEIEEDVAALVTHGALKDSDAPTRWKLADRISYPW